MTDKQLTTPVLFLIFNRPDITQKVFDEIRKVKPFRLFVAADGPRIDKPGEAEKCQQTKDIIKQVDWNCEVFTLFSDENLGCRKAVSSAISWFFNNVEEGIILEDDCVPDQSFFLFCQELLEYYRDDERVMHINGDNFQNGKKIGDGSYYFSAIAHCWGWATWKRAWELFDVDMKDFPEFKKQNKIREIFDNRLLQKAWLGFFQSAYDNKVNSWAFPWSYTVYKHKGLCITPNLNLISNIGFTGNATHTNYDSQFANLRRFKIEEIVHPSSMVPDKKADNLVYQQNYNISLTYQSSIMNVIKGFLRKLLKAQ